MSIENLVKSLQKIMRQDAGVDGDAQRIAQIVWILFLKIYDAKESLWEIYEQDYLSIIPEPLRWRNWANDELDGQAMTGETLLTFINSELFPALKSLSVDEATPRRQSIVKFAFEDAHNYMKNGVLLRQVINKINDVDFKDYRSRHAFNDIYETILKDLQSAGNAGEFYTPRPITEFIVDRINPQLGESIADFACGTGGFLTTSQKHLEEQAKSIADRMQIQGSLHGVEKKALPYLLCMTNMLLHDIDEPNVIHGNSLEKNVRDYNDNDKFDVILMNPPYGGNEEEAIRSNFPAQFQTSETADLFMAEISYRLKENGRCGIVLPDGFLFGNDNAKVAIKKKLLGECNLHTIIRLPAGVFAPYTPITTNLLFFEKGQSTQKIDYYTIPLPEDYKSFSKKKQLKNEHLEPVKIWWNHRDEECVFSHSVTIHEIISNNYNLDNKNPKLFIESQDYTLNELVDKMINDGNEMLDLLSKLKDFSRQVNE